MKDRAIELPAARTVPVMPSLLRTAMAASIIGLCLAGWATLKFSTAACRADFPAVRWNRQDISLLAGCWQRFSNMTSEEVSSRRTIPVQSWSFCFSPRGSGEQTLIWQDDAICVGGAQASFEGSTLVIEAALCRGRQRSFVADTLRCSRLDDGAADCRALEVDPALRRGRDWTSASPGLFRRR